MIIAATGFTTPVATSALALDDLVGESRFD